MDGSLGQTAQIGPRGVPPSRGRSRMSKTHVSTESSKTAYRKDTGGKQHSRPRTERGQVEEAEEQMHVNAHCTASVRDGADGTNRKTRRKGESAGRAGSSTAHVAFTPSLLGRPPDSTPSLQRQRRLLLSHSWFIISSFLRHTRYMLHTGNINTLR